MLNYICELLKELLRALCSALWSFFAEFYEWAFNQLVSLIQTTLNSLGFDCSLQWASSFWANFNFFFPVNETFAMLTVVFVFWLSCFSVKVFLKLFPTVY